MPLRDSYATKDIEKHQVDSLTPTVTHVGMDQNLDPQHHVA